MGEGVRSTETRPFPVGRASALKGSGLISGSVVSPACWPHLCSLGSETKARSLPASACPDGETSGAYPASPIQGKAGKGLGFQKPCTVEVTELPLIKSSF